MTQRRARATSHDRDAPVHPLDDVLPGEARVLGILALQARGYRKLEAVIAGFIGVIVAAFAAQVVLAEPSAGDAAGGLVPGFEGSESVLLAVVTALIVGLNLFLLEQTLV